MQGEQDFNQLTFEFRTARKDYEDCVLHAAENEILAMGPDSVLKRLVGIHKDDDSNKMEIIEKMRNNVRFYVDFDNKNVFLAKKQKRPINWFSNFCGGNDFVNFLTDNGIDVMYASTQHNCVLDQEIVKIHGDPTRNHHDWVIARHNDQHFLCHVLCFVYIGKLNEMLQFPYGMVNESGEHAVCHSVDQDMFSNARPAAFLYGEGNHTSYRTDENCALIRGWAKHTSEINGTAILRRKLSPTLIMIQVSNIISTCIGIEDSLNTILHSYIFLPPSKN